MSLIKLLITASVTLLFSNALMAESFQSQNQFNTVNTSQQNQQQKSKKMNLSKKQIRNVQQNLNDNGYSVSVDGIQGKQTTKAIKMFQLENNLVASGTLDTNTLQALGLNTPDQNTTDTTQSQTRKPASVNSEPMDTEIDNRNFKDKMENENNDEVYPNNEDMD